MGLSISEATTTRAPCCFPSRTALCCGTSCSSASCSWSPDFQGVIFFCTSAQRSSLFCSPEGFHTNGVRQRNVLKILGVVIRTPPHLCLVGSSLQADAPSGQEQGFSKEVKDPQRNVLDSQTSSMESTHHQLNLTDLEKCKIWSGGKRIECYTMEQHFSKFYLFRSTHLNTVISDRMKATKEEMLLNLHPILVGISK